MNVRPHVAHRPIRRVPVLPDLSLRVIDYLPAQVDATHPPVVMLHGLSSNARMWDGVGAVLADHGVASCAIDQRGHGLSDKPVGPYDMIAVTDDLARYLEVENLRRPVLVGQSWGANVVMEFAARFPGRVAGVVPVDGGFIELSKVFPDWHECERVMAPPRLAGTPAATLRQWFRSAHPDWSEMAVDSMMGFVEISEDGLASPWLTYENHISVLRGLWEHRPSERYRTVTDPVWWVVADPPLDASGWVAQKRPALSEIESLLPLSRATWMAGDHDLHAQHPEQVAQILLDAMSEGYFRFEEQVG